ncbi:hypothetical protein [Rhizomonospora bruguierae]|uniref:hypothetical protein n=1 Tax=Rhizomonospora bruguierae TaxID=1581705 RepID=UPI001BD0A094|nr:hypothetical protein [Micromonospora sp. NBRC 107566]
MPSVSYDEYVLTRARTLARKHRPRFNWITMGVECRCGSRLPCRATLALPIARAGWPA